MKSILLFLALTVPTFAASNDPRPGMHALAQDIAALQRYLFSEAQFAAPENDKAIKASLDSMNKHLKEMEKGTFKGDPVLQTNVTMLSRHMSDASRSFQDGNKRFARYMVQSSLQMCISCHTRGKVEWDFALPEDTKVEDTSPEQADFYFATRQFEKGRAVYEAAVKGYPKNKVGTYGLRKAMLSLAVYFARVKEDPKAGAAYFASLEKRNDLPTFLRQEVSAWAKDFAAWAKEKPLVSDKATESQLLEAARKLLRSDDFSLVGDSDRNFHVRRLRASALLHRALELTAGPSPSKGQALHLLGQIYHRINHHLFFRFGEMYLKACIHEYKKTKTAQGCFQSLEQAVTEGFTGSAGTSIPTEDEVELMQLRRLAY